MEILGVKVIGLISAFFTSVLKEACELGASDIHIDPGDTSVCIRFRILGTLVEKRRLDLSVKQELVGRIKILSKLRTDIQDRSQDGRFAYNYFTEKIDIRVSVVPTFYGESVVLRVLRPEYQRDITFSALGMQTKDITDIERILKQSSGVVLVSGPTGSGKTTTIYALIQYLLACGKNIVTIEDPVEYVMRGVRQVQVQDKTFPFAEGLRAVLRQDPEVIVIGEIRDSETAELAFRAGLTGHLVIASMHAGSASGVFPRLRDLGVSENLLSLVSLSIGQRLQQVFDPSGKLVKRTGVYECVVPRRMSVNKIEK